MGKKRNDNVYNVCTLMLLIFCCQEFQTNKRSKQKTRKVGERLAEGPCVTGILNMEHLCKPEIKILNSFFLFNLLGKQTEDCCLSSAEH